MFVMINDGKTTAIDKETAMMIVAILKNASNWHIHYEDNAPDLYYDVCFSDFEHTIRIREEG